MQLLAYLTSGYDAKAIAPVSGEVAVRNTLQIQPGSQLYKGISEDLRYHLENGKGVVYFNHHFAVRKDYFDRSPLLREFWEVESYTTTSFNEDFLSTFRAKHYPFFGVQFHP
jgi:anthranilate/para-aminobenzoate synthase component II